MPTLFGLVGMVWGHAESRETRGTVEMSRRYHAGKPLDENEKKTESEEKTEGRLSTDTKVDVCCMVCWGEGRWWYWERTASVYQRH